VPKTEISRVEAVIDSAVGPFVIETVEVQGFSIDDYVKTTVESQAIHLQIREAVKTVDTRFTKNRTPVVSGDLRVGGFSG
jgi:hypothetical protein